MRDKRQMYIFLSLLAAISCLVWCGCEEEGTNTPTGTTQYNVRVIVLENATDVRVAGAYIVVNGDATEACYTSEPGGDSGGECTFVLPYGEHEFVVSKTGYQTATEQKVITEMTPSVYIALWKR